MLRTIVIKATKEDTKKACVSYTRISTRPLLNVPQFTIALKVTSALSHSGVFNHITLWPLYSEYWHLLVQRHTAHVVIWVKMQKWPKPKTYWSLRTLGVILWHSETFILMVHQTGSQTWPSLLRFWDLFLPQREWSLYLYFVIWTDVCLWAEKCSTGAQTKGRWSS